METILNNNDLAWVETGNYEDKLDNNEQLSRKEKRGLRVILGHAGKKKVFGAYLRTDPEMARKYLEFVSDHAWVRYFHWDAVNNRFMTAG